LNQNTNAATGSDKFEPITSHSFTKKGTSMLELHLQLSKIFFRLNQNTIASTGYGKFKPITSYSFVSKVTSMQELHPGLSKKINYKLN
jgi:hypothetical protein